MKALVIAPQPFLSPRGTPFSVYYRTLVTAQLGVEIDLLTYGEGQDVSIPGVRIIRIPRFPFLGHVKVGPSYVKCFLDVFMILWTVALLLRHRYDFVHAHEEAVFFCRFLKPIFGFKLVYDMHSSLPQQLTNFQFTASKCLIGLFERLERSCLCSADAVITICPDLARYAEGLVRRRDRHFLIENSIFEPIKLAHSNGNGSSNKAGEYPLLLPSDKRLIVYAGTLEPYQGMDILIRAFSKVMLESPDALLLIVGGTKAQVRHYSELAKKCGIGSRCLFTGSVSPSLAKHYSRLASVLVSPRRTGTNTPLKIYEQLASGIPLVATNIYSHTQVLNERVAFLVDPEPEDMARGILEVLKPDGRHRFVSANAVHFYEERYSRPVYEKKINQLLKTLSNGKDHRPSPLFTVASLTDSTPFNDSSV